MKDSSKSKKIEVEGGEEESSTSFGESIHSLFMLVSHPANAWITRIFILVAICVVAFAIRLFAVIRYESVIHEFDPYFNFRSTKVLVEQGFYEFNNWFDDFSWYPLGRVVGGTVYPGIMITSATVYWILHAVHISIDIRNVCVLLAPLFASFTCIVAYFLGTEVHNKRTGLLSAALIALVPGYISRSVAGSYDNECISIFILLLTFWLFIKAVKKGSLFFSCLTSLSYFYMVNSWGGYIFICNLIPLYVLLMLVSGRYSGRLYIAYTIFYILGTILAMQVRFVGFQAIQSSEHMASFGVFVLIQFVEAIQWMRSLISPDRFAAIVRGFVACSIILAAVLFGIASVTGHISPWTGRFYSLLDPTYAKANIPIIASVSEHQPTTWSSFFFDLYILVIFVPVGIFYCFFTKLTDGKIFMILYCLTSVYFSGVMVRLMLVLAPASCVLASIGVSCSIDRYVEVIQEKLSSLVQSAKKKSKPRAVSRQWKVASLVLIALTYLLITYTWHCNWVTSEAYSSPSIVLAANGPHGRTIFDDFREAYYWLRMNTPENAKVMSWWDYGYQLTAMSNRTVIVDNNTWNNTHIATVGKAMASDEETAYEIINMLDVDYVLVIFGGLSGYASDDINKFLWMVRIGGTMDPSLKEEDYFSQQRSYTVGKDGSPTMLNCLMYKMSFYRFGEIQTDYNTPSGFDRARNVEIGKKDISFKHMEEAFTSEHWMVRIFRVKKPENFE